MIIDSFNSIEVSEKKIKIIKDVIDYIKKNLDKNVSYEDIFQEMLKKMDKYKLKNEDYWMYNFMNGWLIIKKDRIMYKKEKKYLKEKKLVDDYFKSEKNITSLNLNTFDNTINFQKNLSSFLNYLSINKINIKLYKYLLDYHYIEKKKLNKFYLEKKVLKYIDIIIKQKEEVLKKKLTLQ